LTQVGLKARREFGIGSLGVANWFGGDQDVAGVTPNGGHKEED
jgi:hypothetical protein